jgi:hypothetical protein
MPDSSPWPTFGVRQVAAIAGVRGMAYSLLPIHFVVTNKVLSRSLVVVLLGLTSTVGAVERGAPQAAPPARTACDERFTRTELYFGSARPDGSTVTDEDFGSFLDEEITPRFPGGLTLLVGSGQFKHGAGIVRERSFVLILLQPRPTPSSSANIEAIRQAYKTRFAQDSVLRVDSQTTRVCF